ncbi:threonine--tRNA ligase [Actinoplanes sp. N902-109]|uniref:threonine--tRNA ligase n=1 Tax=Actinoplanes sp. (strain N902-109) TaxID=649831 RepID=UPI0003293B3D|nr:threonine--tRNA ligase [Actinoplanes sp. N902-109]AGL15889.1 threonyl-tRNA synthetase [Actinoplanes sp. N902-109]
MDIDHRKLGRDLDIFDSDPMIGAGLPFWLPAGAAARHEIELFLYELERRAGYRHVYSPVLGKRQMYELSGHWANFADDMFPPMRLGGDELVMRPSLCPHHALMFRSRPHSYRELPLRIAELGAMYRAERSGVLGGLTRVRSIALNDAHIFCTPSQVGHEVAEALHLVRRAQQALGLRVSSYQLSLRGSGGKYVGSEESWASAEKMLREALDALGVPYGAVPGEAAFYGPKIDIQIADPAGRESTISTVQIDFHMPQQFDLSYTDAAGAKARPVMVHRSLAGSMERLFAALLEVHAGAFPVWFSPVQIVAVPIAAAQQSSAASFVRAAVDAGLRAEVSAEGSLGSRIRAAAHRKIPYAAVIGPREQSTDAVAVRLRDGRHLPPMPTAQAIALISDVTATHSPDLLPARPR